jgi:hypothetical protein
MLLLIDHGGGVLRESLALSDDIYRDGETLRLGRDHIASHTGYCHTP